MDSTPAKSNVGVAGCGAISALGSGLQVLEQALLENRCGLRPCPQRSGSRIDPHVIGFVPDEFVASLRQADPVHAECSAFLFADAALRQAIDACGSVVEATTPSRRALVLSTTKGQVDALERQVAEEPGSDPARRHILPHTLGLDLARRHEVRGPVRCISAACISGLLALQQGVALIQRDQADLALVVGVDIVSHFVLAGFDTLKSLDPEGCRPFDKDRVGLTLGDGAGAIVLTRADQLPGCPERIVGWGSSNDANHLTGPSRDGSGLALAIERALKKASLSSRTVDYVNAHGTGTPYNDNMESLALHSVFGDATPPFSGSKGIFGHTLGAAGVLETILCVLALRRRLMPGTPRLRAADPVAPASLLKEPVANEGLQRVLKLNSGFGGANAALVIEKEVG